MLRLVGSAAEWTDVRIFATRLLLANGRGAEKTGEGGREKVGAALRRCGQRDEKGCTTGLCIN